MISGQVGQERTGGFILAERPEQQLRCWVPWWLLGYGYRCQAPLVCYCNSASARTTQGGGWRGRWCHPPGSSVAWRRCWLWCFSIFCDIFMTLWCFMYGIMIIMYIYTLYYLWYFMHAPYIHLYIALWRLSWVELSWVIYITPTFAYLFICCQFTYLDLFILLRRCWTLVIRWHRLCRMPPWPARCVSLASWMSSRRDVGLGWVHVCCWSRRTQGDTQ